MSTVPNAQSVSRVVLDGRSLSVADLVGYATDPGTVEVSPRALTAVALAHERMIAARDSGSVYGANTGVGANRSVALDDETAQSTDEESHGRRLLRSHASGVGQVEDDVTTRAAMIIRLNQFLAGGSGISVEAVHGLANALASNSLPTMHRIGSIGTADLTALAELALTLIGERPWRTGGIGAVALAESDALPFMSSSAVTLATAAIASEYLASLLQAATVVTSLSFLALQGSGEAYDASVHSARPHPGQARAAERLRYLTEPVGGDVVPGRRIQDPFGLRVAPQVQAPADTALTRIVDAIELEINSATENPLVVSDGVRHHGQFHIATLAAGLDSARVAALPVFSLSASRLSALVNPEMTQLRPFLAGGPATSSGLMILEYVVQDALSSMRVATTPVTGANVSVSRGMEEHASFAPHSARMLGDLCDLGSIILGVELVAATRALRQAPARVAGTRAQPLFDRAAAALPASTDDRPLGGDVEIAAELLPELVALARFRD